MKKINALLALAALASPLFYMGCSSDVYDPDKTTVEPTPNPIGQGFSAPDGFKWSMINTVKLNVAVKDEFKGAYKYLVEVFTSSPLNNTSITPIAAGLTNSSYSTDIAISTDIKRLYIRQTDPKGRKEIYEYAVPEGGGTITAQLYFTEVSTKALSTRATVNHGTSGWDKITALNYTEESYTLPTVNSEINSSNQLENGAKYLIKSGETFNRDIDSKDGSSRATVYVQGTWNVPNGASLQGLDIIILNGGIISGNFMLGSGPSSTLTIQKGGNLSSDSFSTDGGVIIKNFGTINIGTVTSFNTNTLIYNAIGCNININEIQEQNKIQIHNKGNFIISKGITMNNDPQEYLVNYSTGVVKAQYIKNSATIINDNLIEVDDYNSTTNQGYVYNNCTFIAKNSFKFGHLIQDKGSLTAGAGSSSELQKAIPNVSSYDSGATTLNNGSFLKATNFSCGSSLTIDGGSSTKSMLQVGTITYNWTTFLSGNLILGVTTEINAGTLDQWGHMQNVRCDKKSSVQTTTYDGAKDNIENCTGIVYEGDPGVAPYIPTVPTINDASIYTYAFEDNWPVYGDFDMNDLVVALKNKSVSSDGKTVTFNLSLEAVGATKQLGLGIRIMNLSATPTVTVKNNPVTLESDKTFIVFTDAHKEFGYNDSRPFINTVKGASTNKTAIDYTVSLAFSSAISASAFNINNFDTFIISKAADKTKRTEVHLAGYPATGEGNTSQYGKGNDNSNTSGNYYLSKENLAWAIVVPADFKWPLEFKKATDAYSNLESWVTSGGKENTDWYKHSTSGSVYE